MLRSLFDKPGAKGLQYEDGYIIIRGEDDDDDNYTWKRTKTWSFKNNEKKVL